MTPRLVLVLFVLFLIAFMILAIAGERLSARLAWIGLGLFALTAAAATVMIGGSI